MSPYGIYDRKTFSPGQLLIRPGTPADHAYLIQSGRARVFSPGLGRRAAIADVGAGEIVGDMALIRKTPHHYGVEAIDLVTAVVISHDHIQKVLDHADPLLKTILAGMLRRIDQLNAEKQPKVAWARPES